MRYLVTGTQGLYLVDKNVCSIVDNLPNHFYGLTWNEKNIFAIEAIKDQASAIWTFDKEINLVKKSPLPGVKAPHQAFWCPIKNRLLICNTLRNEMAIWSPNSLESANWTEWNRKHDIYHKPEIGADINHLNSIWSDGKYYWTTEHNRSKSPSCIKRLSLDFEVLDNWKIGEHIHNIYVENNSAYFCDSKNNRFSCFNLKTKQRKNVELRVGDWCYPRGLAAGPDYFLVGLSFMGPKKRRKEADHFYVATIKDMKIVDMRKITRSFCSGAMGQIFEIRLLDELDKAHNGLKGS